MNPVDRKGVQVWWNIGVGVVFILGGLSGEMVLAMTESSGLLALVGFCLLGFGLFQLQASNREASRFTQVSGTPRPATTTNCTNCGYGPLERGEYCNRCATKAAS